MAEEESVEYLDSLSYTFAYRRSSLPWKSFSVVNSAAKLRSSEVSLSHPVRSSKKLGLAYVFT